MRCVTWRRRSALGVTVLTLTVAGCASLDRTAETVVMPVRYTLVGADTGLRANLQQGLTQLEAAEFQGALRSLNRAIWDLQQIEDHKLRMEELARAYQAIGDAYRGARRPEWAEDEWRLAATLAERARQPATPAEGPSPLDRAKAAYAAAQFPASVSWLRRAMVDLEEAGGFVTRLKRLEEAHCYLGFAYVALGQEDRAREEFQRLVALDASVTLCSCAAAPKVRRLIAEAQRSVAR
jgi:Tfp pilus assembly protein PilF